MGLFSDRRRLPRPAGLQLSLRLHSEYSLAEKLARGAHALRVLAVAAINDARVVAVVLVVAGAALAVEMTASFKQ